MGFGTVFGVLPHKNLKGRQLCSPAEQSHPQKRPKSPISMHRMATIFTDLTLKIFEHIRSENRCDPTHFTTLSVHYKNVVKLKLVFAI